MLLFYCGCAWAADAVEMMLLSFLGPAVTPLLECLPNSPAQLQSTEILLSSCQESRLVFSVLTGSSALEYQVQAV